MEAVHPTRQLFRFGLFEADAAHNALTRNGVRVKIQDQPFRVLMLLLQRPGEIVTREELREKLWPDGTFVDFDGSLNAILKKLRAAIDDNSDNPCFVETIPRHGYRFIAPVSVTDIATAANHANGVPSQDTVDVKLDVTSSPVRRLSSRRPLFLASVMVMVIAALLATTRISWYRKAAEANRLTLSAHASPPVSMRKSVAVLGFHNVSGNASDTWMATAFSEMLSTELAAGEKLRLISGEDVTNLRASSPWPQAGTLDQKTATRIGTALNSDLLILGSYTTIGSSDGAKVRLDVRLQEATTGEVLTEAAESAGMQDLLLLVSRVGEKLRDRLGVTRLEGSDEVGVLASLPLDREAARFYSLGLAKLREFDVSAAKDLLEQACHADPKFALAHLMLARAWGGLGYEQKRKEEAKKALDLSASLPRMEQLLVQGDYYSSLSDHEKSASTYRALFELFPDSVDYGLLLAYAQHAAGHDSQASETISRLRRLPVPASDDPRIDLLDARAGSTNDPARLVLILSAERKATEQGKKLLYAQARKEECLNLNYSEHPTQASPACEEAYKIYLAAGNRLMAADTLRLLGDVEGSLSQRDQAIATYQQALKMLEALGEHYKTGAVLNNMAINFENQGKLDRAEQLYRQAKFHFEKAGDKVNTATALGNIADILFLRGDLPGAEELYGQGLDIANSLDHSDPVYLLSRFSDLALTQGRVQDAHRLAQQAVDSDRPHQGAYQYLTAAMVSLGEALKAEGDLRAARQQFEEAVQIRQKVGEPDLIAEGKAQLADLDLDEGHADHAEQLLRPAITEFEKDKSDPDATSAYTSFSRALQMQGKSSEARKAIDHAAELARNSPDPALKLPITIQTVRLEAAEGESNARGRVNVAAPRARLNSALATAKKLGYYNLECEIRLALGEIEIRSNPASGRAQLTTLAAEARSKGLELLARQAEQALAASSETPTKASH